MKELFIRVTVHVFPERLSIRACASFSFDFVGVIWNIIVLVSDHCLPSYFE